MAMSKGKKMGELIELFPIDPDRDIDPLYVMLEEGEEPEVVSELLRQPIDEITPDRPGQYKEFLIVFRKRFIEQFGREPIVVDEQGCRKNRKKYRTFFRIV